MLVSEQPGCGGPGAPRTEVLSALRLARGKAAVAPAVCTHSRRPCVPALQASEAYLSRLGASLCFGKVTGNVSLPFF